MGHKWTRYHNSGVSECSRLGDSKVSCKKVSFALLFFLVLFFSVPWYPLSGREPPSTHSLISLLSPNWYWLRLFVGRRLDNNQLKEFPEDIFRNNIELSRSLHLTLDYHTQIANRPIGSRVTDLTWLRYLTHLAEFGYGKLVTVLFSVRLDGIIGSFGVAIGISAGLPCQSSIQKLTWAGLLKARLS